MYPDSSFARPVSSFRRPAPVLDIDPDVQPDKTVCFRSEWTPYIVGALRQLLLQTTWATDDPSELNLMQARAQLLIALFMEGCPPEPENTDGKEFDGDELMPSLCEAIRYHDGKLQAYCCGEWTDVSGQPAQGIGGPGQPGGGTPQPDAGACQTYHASFSGNTQWLVPTLVNAGDVLTFSNAKGAAPDGGISGLWYCPNGQTFFAGACVGVPGPHAGDFDTSIAHMRLIAIVNGVAYPADTGTLTIPGGVSNAQVVIQANDSSIADNSGSYTLDIEVCNNKAKTWCVIQNYELSDWGGVIGPEPGAGFTEGQWTPGTGFEATSFNTGTFDGKGIYVYWDFAHALATLDELDIEFNYTGGSDFAAGEVVLRVQTDNGVMLMDLYPTQPANGHQVLVVPISGGNTSHISIDINSDFRGTAGAVTIKSTTWKGTGDYQPNGSAC